MIWISGEASAQRLPEPYPIPDSATALQRLYGVDDEEFVLGAYVTKYSNPLNSWGGSTNADLLWSYLHSLGCNLMYTTIGGDPGGYLPRLVEEADAGDRIMMVDFLGGAAGFGRDIELYPWDSAQTDAYKNKFLGRNGGTTVWNSTEFFTVDSVNYDMHEKLYSMATGDTVNQPILWNIAYGWQPQHVRRYRVQNAGWSPDIDSTQNSSEMTIQRDPKVMTLSSPQHTHYVGVTGHLASVPNSGVANGESVLRIEIWNEVPKGTSYIDSSGAEATDFTADREFHYATIEVPKDSLRKLNLLDPFDRYRTPSFPINLDRCSGCMGGPLRNAAHRFDVRVYWTGKEAVYLRSISLRDSIGQLVDGRLPGSAAFRQKVMDTARYCSISSAIRSRRTSG